MKMLKNILAGLCVALVVCVPAVADNGCENDNNDAIVAELALCSTHAYNIAETKNPTGADKELMRDVIAMKTTLITQQMYRQYEQMESMLRRLKTQLEKAVLTTGLEAKGASSSSSSSSGGSSFKSDDRNIHMYGAKNCNEELLPADVMKCLNTNMNTISNATGNADDVSLEAAKQLANDFTLLKNTAPTKKEVCNYSFGTSDKTEDKIGCLDSKQIRKKTNFRTCFDNMRSCLRTKTYELSQNEKKQDKD
ncbi:MAG: hypothetical protein R8M70_04790 [Alphaproteobacteria bacterium]|nr:hypothetical protein [Alphaproteobacteria bacterium]